MNLNCTTNGHQWISTTTGGEKCRNCTWPGYNSMVKGGLMDTHVVVGSILLVVGIVLLLTGSFWSGFALVVLSLSVLGV